MTRLSGIVEVMCRVGIKHDFNIASPRSATIHKADAAAGGHFFVRIPLQDPHRGIRTHAFLELPLQSTPRIERNCNTKLPGRRVPMNTHPRAHAS